MMLMNSPWGTSHHGAMTDLNIWDRILTEQEQSDWMFCKTEAGAGNLVSWQSAHLNITGLFTDLIEREETCPAAQIIPQIMAFNTKLNFYDSQMFCKKMEGQLAVATNQETSDLMKETFSNFCPRERYFYSGYTD